MSRRIAVLQGHPDPAGGHEVRRIDVARLEFPLLHNAQEWEWKPPPEPIAAAQQAIAWAEHLAIFYPLWKKKLAGRSARIVVTMGMPAFFYRVYYRAHSLKSLKRNILAFCGISPVRTTLIGIVEGRKQAREEWLAKLGALGARGG